MLALAGTLAGCGGQPLLALSPDVLKPTSTVVRTPGADSRALPVPPPPEVVQVLRLTGPAARGRVTLTKALRYVADPKGEPTRTLNAVAKFDTLTTYTAGGSASVTDDLGTWTFTYVNVPLRDAALKIDGVMALGIEFQSKLGVPFEIDWFQSAMIGPDDRMRRLLRPGDLDRDSKGSSARTRIAARGSLADWVLPADEGLFERETSAPNAHAFFELLPPGLQMTLAVTVRGDDAAYVRKFAFETRPLRKESPQARPVTKWVGETFIVLPRLAPREGEAYAALRPRDLASRSHADLERAVLKVTAVTYDRLDPVVTLVRESPREEYTARVVGGSVDGLAPVADLVAARNEWTGKTLWLAEPNLQTANGVVPARRFAPVQVVDVNLGSSSAAPARFVVKARDGRVGFRDVHMTVTNVPESQRGRNAFEQVFLIEDPRGEHDWPPAVWTALEESRVTVGMTPEQARLSWGVPRRIEHAVTEAGREERWVYAGRPTLVFVDGALARVVQ